LSAEKPFGRCSCRRLWRQISFSVIPSEVEESLNISAVAEREEPEISRDVSTAVDMTAERLAKNYPE
jgi:hypothetical protein